MSRMKIAAIAASALFAVTTAAAAQSTAAADGSHRDRVEDR